METVLRLGVDSREARQGADAATDALDRTEKQATKTVDAIEYLQKALKLLAASWAALKLADYIKDAALLNARFETMGIVMEVVGRNAGYTANEMQKAATEVQKMGITMLQSRDAVTKFVQAGLELKDAAPLARVAQDAAVIAGLNSSQAFETLIHGIQSAQVEVLRNIGINVSFEDSYKKLAKQLGTNAAQLTEQEKLQARYNVTMEAGARIAGVYEAALGTASKQISSMARYTEDAKVIIGEVFNETLTALVFGFTEHLKNSNKELNELSRNDALKKWGQEVADVIALVADTISTAITGVKALTAVGVYAYEKFKLNLTNRAVGGNFSYQRDSAAAEAKFDASVGGLNGGFSTKYRDAVTALRAQKAADAQEKDLRNREEQRDADMADLMGVRRAGRKPDVKRGLTDAQLNKIKTFMDKLEETVLEKEQMAEAKNPQQIEIDRILFGAKKAGVSAKSIQPQIGRIVAAEAKVKERAAYIEGYQEQLKAEEELTAAIENRDNAEQAVRISFQQAGKLQVENAKFQLEIATQSSAEQQRLTALRNVDLEVTKLSLDATAEQKARLQALGVTLKEDLTAGFRAVKAANEDWMNGAQKAVSDYRDQLSNLAGQTETSFRNVFKSAEDDLTKFVRTGKFSFSSLMDTVINELIRIAVVRPLLKNVGDMLDGILAKGRSATGSGGSEGGLLGILGGLASKVFGGGDSTGAYGALGVSAADFALAPFADGGIMTSKGPVRLRRYANGGITNGPQLRLAGEGDRNEAMVPLPDGRTIPVTLTGGQRGDVISISVTVQGDTVQSSATGSDAVDYERLGQLIGVKVRQVIVEEKRNGGSLRTG